MTGKNRPGIQNTRRPRRKIIRIACIAIGSLFVIIGVIGIILPLVPTTPFLLLAAACYAQSSDRLYDWLLNSKWCGRYVRSYRTGSGVPVRVKVLTVAILWSTIMISIFFATTNIFVRVILLLIALGVTIHILLLPTFKEHPSKTGTMSAAYRNCPGED